MPRTEEEVEAEIATLTAQLDALKVEKDAIRADAGLPRTGRKETPIKDRTAEAHKNKKQNLLYPLGKNGAASLSLGARRNIALYLYNDYSDGESHEKFRKDFVKAYNKGEGSSLPDSSWEDALLAILPEHVPENLAAAAAKDNAPLPAPPLAPAAAAAIARAAEAVDVGNPVV